jgi:hypothetical protein
MDDEVLWFAESRLGLEIRDALHGLSLPSHDRIVVLGTQFEPILGPFVALYWHATNRLSFRLLGLSAGPRADLSLLYGSTHEEETP